jgi:hypothetical protein
MGDESGCCAESAEERATHLRRKRGLCTGCKQCKACPAPRGCPLVHLSAPVACDSPASHTRGGSSSTPSSGRRRGPSSAQLAVPSSKVQRELEQEKKGRAEAETKLAAEMAKRMKAEENLDSETKKRKAGEMEWENLQKDIKSTGKKAKLAANPPGDDRKRKLNAVLELLAIKQEKGKGSQFVSAAQLEEKKTLLRFGRLLGGSFNAVARLMDGSGVPDAASDPPALIIDAAIAVINKGREENAVDMFTAMRATAITCAKVALRAAPGDSASRRVAEACLSAAGSVAANALLLEAERELSSAGLAAQRIGGSEMANRAFKRSRYDCTALLGGQPLRKPDVAAWRPHGDERGQHAEQQVDGAQGDGRSRGPGSSLP